MYTRIFSSSLAVALAVLMADATQAAELLNLGDIPVQTLAREFTFDAQGNPTRGLSASFNRLHTLHQHTDRRQITHMRMQQHYAGFPVFGGYAIVHTPEKTPRAVFSSRAWMNGRVYRGLHNELGQPSSAFATGGQAALAAFKRPYATDKVSEETVVPMVYIDKQNKAHWAYRVSLLVSYADRIPERPSAIVDAFTYAPYLTWNDIKTQGVPVNGKGFGGNRKTQRFTYGAGKYPFLNLTRDPLTQTCIMQNKRVKVIDMHHRGVTARSKAMSFPCVLQSSVGESFVITGYLGDGYDAVNGAYSPTNDALYAGEMTHHLYQDWYGMEALTNPDGTSMQLIMRVHYGQGYENAYWDGKQMTFGDGYALLYPLVSLGVTAHEISHGFTEQHSDLIYEGQSGGLNESFSDMAAQAAEVYAGATPSWMLGEEILKEDSGIKAMRYMDKPSRDGSSIDTATEYFEGLNVHYSSGVYNRLFYLLATQPGWGVRKAFDVMVKANTDYWIPYTNFTEAGCGVIQAAEDLGYSTQTVTDMLKEVAITDLSGCKHITE